jgi:hypothetical protein
MNTASCELRASSWIPQPSSQAITDGSMERAETVRMAMSLGVPIHQIEAYLDWLDAVRQAGRRNGKRW